MKNTATPSQASDAWAAALRRFDSDLQRRGAAERTRRAYGGDVGELAAWAAAQGIEPAAMSYRALRGYAARLSDGTAGPRRLASIQTFYRSLVDHDELAASPADLLATPEPARTVERVDVAILLDRVPATTPLDRRDRALFELAHACGLGAEELVNLDEDSIDFDGGQVRLRDKGGETRCVPAGDGALAAIAGYLKRARPALAGAAGDPALFLSKSGRRLSPSDVRRRLRVWARYAAAQGAEHPHALRLLGHSSISTTQVYTRIESARLRAAYLRSHPRA